MGKTPCQVVTVYFLLYRVHLYYQDDLRTRIAYWETKYPEISKSIEPDENIIRLNSDQNNTLSRAIEEANALKFPLPNHPEDLIHDPPTPPDEIKVNKKVKVMGPFGLPTPDTRKTRNELLSEVRNLRVNLAMISTDLQKRTQENCQLRKDLEKTQKKMQTLVDQQKSFKTFFHQFINNLPTSSKSHYENMFSKFDQTCGDGSALEQEPEDLDIESPKSRDFSCSNHSDQFQNLEDGQPNALPIEQMPIQALSNFKPVTLEK